MSTLTIVAPSVGPTPPAAPGKLVDAPASARPGEVPRADIVVQLSEQVRPPNESEKQDNDERKNRFRDRKLSSEPRRNERNGETSAHGHAPGDTCPLCRARGTQPPRVHGTVDRSA